MGETDRERESDRARESEREKERRGDKKERKKKKRKKKARWQSSQSQFSVREVIIGSHTTLAPSPVKYIVLE